AFRERLAAALERLARERIYIGTSSWKYEGWLDQIYTRSNYLHHGRFSKRAFEAECLREYATLFPTVCGDFAFYQFPTEEFLELLDPFLAALPRRFRYAVEIRNEELLEHDYFECLRSHGVAHVFNAWSRMPELSDQIAIPEAFTSDFLVSRALLRRGRKYED